MLCQMATACKECWLQTETREKGIYYMQGAYDMHVEVSLGLQKVAVSMICKGLCYKVCAHG